ncbi:hypothetical protein RB195_012414 [Necator americanus]|uniref:Uncharacterized protein n=1 Tax=Necator americanus TaxID=51031 RepID=A0ABR1D744_NECAM
MSSLRRAEPRPSLQRLAPVLEEDGDEDEESGDDRNSFEENDCDMLQTRSRRMLDGVQSRHLLSTSYANTTIVAMPGPSSTSTSRGVTGRRRASAFVRRVSMAIPTLTADPVPFSAVSIVLE